MLDENEKIVFQIFQERLDVSLQKIPESPKRQTPDVKFEILGNTVVAEIKTLEDAFRINLDTSKMKMNTDGFLESPSDEVGSDNSWSRVARAVEKASYQLNVFRADMKAVILLNKDCAIIDDLNDLINGYITLGKFKGVLPQGALIAIQNWKCVPDLFFWADNAKSEFHIRSIGSIPASVNDYFREKLNA